MALYVLSLLVMSLASCRHSALALSGGDAGGVRSSGGGLNDAVGGHQAPAGVGKFLPEGISRADKLRAFLECRKECIAKCDRLVYVYSTKKEFCHDCIRQCMVAVLQQARSLGIEFTANEERMQGDSPGGGDSPGSSDEERRRRRRRNRQRQREKRQRQQHAEQQKLLKNCIVH